MTSITAKFTSIWLFESYFGKIFVSNYFEFSEFLFLSAEFQKTKEGTR